MQPASILLATDGGPHSRKAEEWAFGIVKMLGIPLTVLHIRDPYLKQFYNEIYAQGRKEYLEHVDRELLSAAREIQSDIAQRLADLGLSFNFILRYGDPLEEIVAEISSGDYDLLVVGGKKLVGIRAYRSWNLPARLSRKLGTASLMIVREEGV